ncbi:MAG: hypothetical protein AAGC55_09345, partial [Myxococcota bacterium]
NHILLSVVLIGASFSSVSACGDDGSGDDGGNDEPSLSDLLDSPEKITAFAQGFADRVLGDSRINLYFLHSGRSTTFAPCIDEQISGAASAACADYLPTLLRDEGFSQADLDDLNGHLNDTLTASGSISQEEFTLYLTELEQTLNIDSLVEDSDNNATVYQRVGRRPGLEAVADRFIQVMAGDNRIDDFLDRFGDIDSLNRFKACLVIQLSSEYGGGPGNYGSEDELEGLAPFPPGDPAGVTQCRTMTVSHDPAVLVDPDGNPLDIEDYTAFVEDMEIALADQGVTAEDIAELSLGMCNDCPNVVPNGVGCPICSSEFY